LASHKMWGGRFGADQDPHFADFNRSLPFDRELLEFDIEGSIAYARALQRAGIFSDRDFRRVDRGLRRVLAECRKNPQSIIDSRAEDVHTYVEDTLSKYAGALALKLHTGRSRNDQVATDLRLYLRSKAREAEMEIDSLLNTLAEVAEKNGNAILPGYTHLQRAQPVLFGHYLLSYGEMLLRDRQRLRECAARASICPLGSGALSGTVYKIGRKELARDLGFASASENSMDAVADRDFVLDYLSFASILLMHLSRLAEDLILYSSAEFGFIRMHDSVASGSSLMPQKKNPDALELIRGKSGRVFGHLHALLTVLKGLPMTYNKDLQEDKEGLFDSIRTVDSSVRITQLVLDTLSIRPERMLEAAQNGYLNATELADYLAAKGLPFRQAHELVGKIVVRALDLGVNLENLSLPEYRSFSPLFDQDLYESLDLRRIVDRRREHGGTGTDQVRVAVAEFEKRVAQ
jgi:argininosuccinate lyase